MDLRLIYVNKIGFNHRGTTLYEFLFSDIDNEELDDVWGEGWEITPALDTAQPPNEEHISSVVELSLRDYELETIATSEHFSVFDSVQGIIALAYEMVDDDFSHDERLVFHFGDKMDDIIAVFNSRKLKYNREDYD